MTRTIAILLVLTGGCSALDPSSMPPPSRYSLDSAPIASQPARPVTAPKEKGMGPAPAGFFPSPPTSLIAR